jgi:hypothetical protein
MRNEYKILVGESEGKMAVIIALMMMAARTSESLVNFYQTK